MQNISAIRVEFKTANCVEYVNDVNATYKRKAKKSLHECRLFLVKYYRPAAALSASALSVFSHVNAVSEPSRPK